MQEVIKNSTAQINEIRSRVQSALQAQWAKAETEGRRVLNQLGAELDAEDNSLNAVVQRIRAKNPDIRTFGRNLDVATYDLRGSLNWNANMMAAYARLKAGERLEADVLPRLQKAREDLEGRVKALVAKARKAD